MDTKTVTTHNTPRGVMRMHRLFFFIAVAMFVFAEALAVGNLFSKARFPSDWLTAFELPIFVTVPMLIAILFYKTLRQLVAGKVDDTSLKKLQTLFLVLLIMFYAGLVAIFTTVLKEASHIR